MLTVLQTIRHYLWRIICFITKSTLWVLLTVILIGIISSGLFALKMVPVFESYRDKAYLALDKINDNTFNFLGDTIIYDKNDNVISEININNYVYTDIDNVSKWVQKGYICVEDRRFAIHNGVDFKALARAGVSFIKNKGNITQGGSTITQQVIKNNILSQERTFKRKLNEFFLAPEIERRYTKQEIMEFYVNTNFYGNNCYGIETASQYYFGKPNKDLTLSEAALFIGMSNNPSAYNPKRNLKVALEKRDFVLSIMLQEGVITTAEYESAKSEELKFVYKREPRAKENYLTSYAIYCATMNLLEQDGFKFQYTFPDVESYDAYRSEYTTKYNSLSAKIRGGGYIIHTSLDVDKQAELQSILDKRLSSFTEVSEDGRYAFQGAAALVNNKTGFVEAIVGGRTLPDGSFDEFNRGCFAKRQPGSSIKPLVVYTPAFNSGLYYPSLKMIDKDDPTDKYYPRNYGGGHMGEITIQEALGRSINTIAYQIMQDIGPNTGLDYLGKMRFNTLTYADNNNTAIALGGFTYGVRVVDMAKGYSTLADMGMYIDNNCIKRIEFQNEGEIFREDSKIIPVFEHDAAYLLIECMKGVLEAPYGTGYGLQLKNSEAIAKTGTTDGAKDLWFCGATPLYSLSVWCGYDTPRVTNLLGGPTTGKIWQEMMNSLHSEKLPERLDFERPNSVVSYSIDYKGNISKYLTEETGLFSQTLLDKAVAEREAVIERKRLERDNALVKEITESLSDLRKFILNDKDGVYYLQSSYKSISREISRVESTGFKQTLTEELNSIQAYFSHGISTISLSESYLHKKLLLEREYSKEEGVVSALNELDSYPIVDVSSVASFDTLLEGIGSKISVLKDISKVEHYMAKQQEIVKNKELLLAPYREEIRLALQLEQTTLAQSVLDKLDNLDKVYVYTEGVEAEYLELDALLVQCREKGIDTYTYEERYKRIRSYIDKLKEEYDGMQEGIPEEWPVVSPSASPSASPSSSPSPSASPSSSPSPSASPSPVVSPSESPVVDFS